MFEQTRQKDFICGALVGSSVAVLTSLLFVTKKGKQIQRKIAETFEDLKDEAQDKFSEVKDKVEDKFADAKDKAEEGAEHLHKKVAHKAKHDDHHKDSK